jgi:hypothetical protein
MADVYQADPPPDLGIDLRIPSSQDHIAADYGCQPAFVSRIMGA